MVWEGDRGDPVPYRIRLPWGEDWGKCRHLQYPGVAGEVHLIGGEAKEWRAIAVEQGALGGQVKALAPAVGPGAPVPMRYRKQGEMVLWAE